MEKSNGSGLIPFYQDSLALLSTSDCRTFKLTTYSGCHVRDLGLNMRSCAGRGGTCNFESTQATADGREKLTMLPFTPLPFSSRALATKRLVSSFEDMPLKIHLYCCIV